MLVEDVRSALRQTPFTPLKVVKTDGSAVDIPFKHVAVILSYGLIVFKGVRSEKSHSAKSFEVVGFDRIARIEPKRHGRPRRPSRKAG